MIMILYLPIMYPISDMPSIAQQYSPWNIPRYSPWYTHQTHLVSGISPKISHQHPHIFQHISSTLFPWYSPWYSPWYPHDIPMISPMFLVGQKPAIFSVHGAQTFSLPTISRRSEAPPKLSEAVVGERSAGGEAPWETIIMLINGWLVVWNIFCFPIYWE